MMQLNWSVILGAGIIPLLIGFIWYNPKVMGRLWLIEAGLEEEKLKKNNIILVFGLTLLFSCFIAVGLLPMVLHPMGLFSMLEYLPEMKDPNSQIFKQVQELVTTYGGHFRTFKHGLLHGFLTAMTFALPIVSINALFEARSWKYILIHFGFWLISLMLMAGVISVAA